MAQQCLGKVYQLGCIGKSWHTTIAIEVGTQAYMIDAHNVDSMTQMPYCIVYACLAIGA